MRYKKDSKGSLPVAFLFIIILSLSVATMLTIYWSESPMNVGRLKRMHARQYAEAAMNEAINRLRTLYVEAGLPGYRWDADSWDTQRTIVIEPAIEPNIFEEINATIDVERDLTPGHENRHLVKARFQYDNRKLRELMRDAP